MNNAVRIGAIIVSVAAAYGAYAAAASRPAGPALEVSIAVPDKKEGKRFQIGSRPVDFHVAVRNRSDKPQRIWADWCSWGAPNLTLEVVRVDGKSYRYPLIVRRSAMIWSANYPDVETLAPGAVRVYDVKLDNGHEVSDPGKRLALQMPPRECFSGFPMPGRNQSCVVSMRAVYSIPNDAWAGDQKVWTGKVVSPVDRFIVMQLGEGNNPHLSRGTAQASLQ